MKAGISWKIYQDTAQAWMRPSSGVGGIRRLHRQLWRQFAALFPPVSELAAGQPALRGRAHRHQHPRAVGFQPQVAPHLFDQFRADVMANKLPKVSWIVAPEAYTEHGNWPANYGAWYVSQFLDALTANPDVWSKTAFFLNYDENDGFFDHVVPQTPPASRAQGISTVATTNEIFPGNASFMRRPDRPWACACR